MAEVDYAALKKGGFMRQIQKDKFSMRLKVIGGQLRAEQLFKIAEVAKKYGKGYVHLTSRQGVEVPFISTGDIEEVKKDLASADVKVSVCGPRVRTVTACQGSAVCPSGAIETTALAEELDARYFGKQMPHKFKIGITGCKNNCLKAEENDFGIKGGIFPEWKSAACTFCGLCAAVCPAGAIALDREKPSLSFAGGACVYCGKCAKTCPSDAWQGKGGYLLSFGGMFGNEIKEGLHLLPLVFDKEKVLKAADVAVRFYQANGKAGERFGRTLMRVGADSLKKDLEEAAR
ncbi:MAG: 4Fe-4S binding protein [Spirochaetia bacterium]|jgi:dissimilatory sulfite reductase (desulfoviridin) alpha/beta subunit|nr:4Fe-4S binding protein [Spirochaetia bacterium]